MLFPPKPAIPQDEQRDRERAYHREVLHDLVRLGLNTAKALERRAIDASMDGSGTGAVTEAAIAFERIARAIRRTILLAEKLADPTTQPEHDPPPTRPARPEASPQAHPETTAADARPESEHPESGEPPEYDPEDHPDPQDTLAGEHPDQRPVATQIAALRAELTRDAPLPMPRPTRTRPEPSTQQPKPRHVFVGPPIKRTPSPPNKPKPNRRTKA